MILKSMIIPATALLPSMVNACIPSGPIEIDFSLMQEASVVVMGRVTDVSRACNFWCDDAESRAQFISVEVTHTFRGDDQSERTFATFDVRGPENVTAWQFGQSDEGNWHIDQMRKDVGVDDLLIIVGNSVGEVTSLPLVGDISQFSNAYQVDTVIVGLCTLAPSLMFVDAELLALIPRLDIEYNLDFNLYPSSN